jgi:hypothetical protein
MVACFLQVTVESDTGRKRQREKKAHIVIICGALLDNQGAGLNTYCRTGEATTTRHLMSMGTECVISGKNIIQIYHYDVRIVRCKINQDIFPYPLFQILLPGESEDFSQTSVATKEKVK